MWTTGASSLRQNWDWDILLGLDILSLKSLLHNVSPWMLQGYPRTEVITLKHQRRSWNWNFPTVEKGTEAPPSRGWWQRSKHSLVTERSVNSLAQGGGKSTPHIMQMRATSTFSFFYWTRGLEPHNKITGLYPFQSPELRSKEYFGFVVKNYIRLGGNYKLQ